MIDGKKLKELRQQNNYSLNKLSEDMNCHPRSISYWESEKRIPNKEHLIKLSEIYHMPYEDLLAFIQISDGSDNRISNLQVAEDFERAEEKEETNLSPIIEKEDILRPGGASSDKALQIYAKKETSLKVEIRFLGQKGYMPSYWKMGLITYAISLAAFEIVIWSIIGIAYLLMHLGGADNQISSFNNLEFILYSVFTPLICTEIFLLLKRRKRMKPIMYCA